MSNRKHIVDNRLSERLCGCGSGELSKAVYDARGIFVTFCCNKCRDRKLRGYRPEIFTNPNYHVDEPIEEDY